MWPTRLKCFLSQNEANTNLIKNFLVPLVDSFFECDELITVISTQRDVAYVFATIKFVIF